MAKATDALTDHADARMALAAVLRAGGDEAAAADQARGALELYSEKENAAGARRAAVFAGIAADAKAEAEVPVERPALTPPSVVEHVARRFTTAHTVRDADALAELMTEDVVFVNHRPMATWDRSQGVAAWVELQEALWATASEARYSLDSFLGGDEVVFIARWRVDGQMGAGGGDFNLTFLSATRLAGDRIERVEMFDEDDDVAARACAERLRAEVVGRERERPADAALR